MVLAKEPPLYGLILHNGPDRYMVYSLRPRDTYLAVGRIFVAASGWIFFEPCHNSGLRAFLGLRAIGRFASLLVVSEKSVLP
jgi:hypothetical protein